MQTPAESEPSHHLKTFEDLLRHGKETLEMLFNNPADYDRDVDEYGVYTIRDDDNLKTDYKEQKKGIKYHTNLCRLHDLGFLIVSKPDLLHGRLETERYPWEYRQIPQMHFLIARDERAKRFLDNLKANPMLSVCVRNSRDDPTNKDMQTGTFYEQVTLYENEEYHKSTWKVTAFSDNHDPENDPQVYEILQNENPYYCSIGMNISKSDYSGQDRETFRKTIGEFDLIKHIEPDKLAEDGSIRRGDSKESNYEEPNSYHVLDGCVRISRDGPTNKDIQTGKFYEQATLYGNEDHELTGKVEALSDNHDAAKDPEDYENPYYCSIGMKTSKTDSKESNYEPNSYHGPRTWQKLRQLQDKREAKKRRCGYAI
ncbi:hypothetical protein RAB80_017071 [Fusarium oxysporum f. sp. vasinfectum]|nr:hypothetical protein RAB80_017071 [Fusarium oxysporum f. sp. vasinfectum]